MWNVTTWYLLKSYSHIRSNEQYFNLKTLNKKNKQNDCFSWCWHFSFWKQFNKHAVIRQRDVDLPVSHPSCFQLSACPAASLFKRSLRNFWTLTRKIPLQYQTWSETPSCVCTGFSKETENTTLKTTRLIYWVREQGEFALSHHRG